MTAPVPLDRRCRCAEGPYLGTHVAGTAERCERCGSLVGPEGAPAPLDLEALAAAVDAMTPGEWTTDGRDVDAPHQSEADCVKLVARMRATWHPTHHGVFYSRLTEEADARGIVALRNAAPALVRRVRDAEEERDTLRRLLTYLADERYVIRWSYSVGLVRAFLRGDERAVAEVGKLISGGATKEADRG